MKITILYVVLIVGILSLYSYAISSRETSEDRITNFKNEFKSGDCLVVGEPSEFYENQDTELMVLEIGQKNFLACFTKYNCQTDYEYPMDVKYTKVECRSK